MSDELSASKEALHEQDPGFRRLETDHHRLELELNELTRHKTLTPEEESHKKQLQIEKLHAKDRMEAMMRRHMKEQPT
jgi:uncharacterized protein YdcH (DUF465 family)